jgi:hypothetical protein
MDVPHHLVMQGRAAASDLGAKAHNGVTVDAGQPLD